MIHACCYCRTVTEIDAEPPLDGVSHTYCPLCECAMYRSLAAGGDVSGPEVLALRGLKTASYRKAGATCGPACQREITCQD